MNIKTKNTTIEIPNVLALIGMLVASNMYANHCKKKSYKTMVDGVTKIIETQVDLEEEDES